MFISLRNFVHSKNQNKKQVSSRHLPLLDWSLTEAVSRLHKHGMAWEDIYWLLWGASHVFFCRLTGEHFMALDYSRRRHHPSAPVLQPSAASGSFSTVSTTGGSADEEKAKHARSCSLHA